MEQLKDRDHDLQLRLFSQNLHALMDRTGIASLDILSEQTGIPKVSLQQYSRGKQLPRIETLVCLADYFMVPLDFLIGRMSEKDSEELLKNYSECFMKLRKECFEERYLKIRKPLSGLDGYEAPFPYNLYDIVLGARTDFVISVDQKQGMEQAIKTLRERERDILLYYYKDGFSLKQIGDIYNLTQERVHQILRHAILKMRSPERRSLMANGLASWIAKKEYNQICAEYNRKVVEIKVKIDELNADFLEYQKKIGVRKDIVDALWRELPKIEADAVDIRGINWSVRTYNCLLRGGCETIADVVEKVRDGSIMMIRNFGRKSLEEVIDRLKEIGEITEEEGNDILKGGD